MLISISNAVMYSTQAKHFKTVRKAHPERKKVP